MVSAAKIPGRGEEMPGVKNRYLHDVISIYQYGPNQMQVIYFKAPLKQGGFDGPEVSGFDPDPEAQQGEGGRESCNIARARARVRELALCNPWDYFVTITLDPDKHDRGDLDAFRQGLAQFIRNQRRLTGANIRYLLIPEQHKAGGWHLHGLFLGLPPAWLRPFTLDERLPYAIRDKLARKEQLFDIPKIANRWGWTTASPIKDREKCASYVSKYITKDSAQAAAILAAGKHLFFASQGLNGKKRLYFGPVANAREIPWAWENEYVKILWLKPGQLGGLQLDPTFRRADNADRFV